MADLNYFNLKVVKEIYKNKWVMVYSEKFSADRLFKLRRP